MTATLLPTPTFQCSSGDHVVIPAQSNGSPCWIEARGKGQHEFFAYYDGLRIPAKGHAAIAPVLAVVGKGRSFQAVLFPPVQAGLALLARVDHATHPDQLVNSDARYLCADLAYTADDLVAWHDGVGGEAAMGYGPGASRCGTRRNTEYR